MTAIRQQIASALDLLIQTGRMTGGRRRVTNIVEVTGIEGDSISLQDLFVFRQSGIDAEGHAKGHFEACGVRPPSSWNASASAGASFPTTCFTAASWPPPRANGSGVPHA